jgi:hypothetical protein
MATNVTLVSPCTQDQVMFASAIALSALTMSAASACYFYCCTGYVF